MLRTWQELSGLNVLSVEQVKGPFYRIVFRNKGKGPFCILADVSTRYAARATDSEYATFWYTGGVLGYGDKTTTGAPDACR